jgi:F-box domain
MEEGIFYFNSMPNEVQLMCFSFLSCKEVIVASQTCRQWKVLLDDCSIWSAFFKILNLKMDQPINGDYKSLVIKKIILLTEETKNSHIEIVMDAYRDLKRLGIGSLESLTGYIDKKIEEIECLEDEYQKNSALHLLGVNCLFIKQIDKAHEIVLKISPSPVRDLIAYELVKCYLNGNDFINALNILQYFDRKQRQSDMALSLFIYKAQEKEEIDIAMKALTMFKDYDIWQSCIQDLFQFLLKKGTVEKSHELKSSFPEAFIKENAYWKAMNYAFSKRSDSAKEIAMSIENDSERERALKAIEFICTNSEFEIDITDQ